MSEWAYYQCLSGNNTEAMRILIEYDQWIYNYCFHIEDRENMWIKLKTRIWSFRYCMNIKDRPEVRKNFTIEEEKEYSIF